MAETPPQVNIKQEKLDTEDNLYLYETKFLSTEIKQEAEHCEAPDVKSQLVAQPKVQHHCRHCPKKYDKLEYLQIHEYVHDPRKHCPICNVEIALKQKLTVHLNGHIKEQMQEAKKLELSCSFCGKSCKNKRSLTIHIRVHTNERPYKCDVCNKRFKQRGALSGHRATHGTSEPDVTVPDDGTKRELCSFCGRRFKNKRNLRAHVRVHTNERPFKCTVCGNAFKQRSTLRAHKITHTDVKAFACELCSVSFTFRSSFQKHMRNVHEGGTTYRCRFCSERLPDVDSYRNHRKVHGRHHKQCTRCALAFTSYYAYVKHSKTHEAKIVPEQASVMYTCILCGERFGCLASHMRHRDAHLGYTNDDFQEAVKSNSFLCKLCGRDFTNHKDLLRHMATHMEKTKRCDACEEFFTYYGYAAHYKTVHATLQCKICKKTLHGRTQRAAHYALRHAGTTATFPCHVCGKSYKAKHPLRLHFQIAHRDQKGFKCHVCGKRYTTRSRLGFHVNRSHSTSARFKCETCNVPFQRLSTLRQHKRSHTSKIDNERCSLELDRVKRHGLSCEGKVKVEVEDGEVDVGLVKLEVVKKEDVDV